MLIIAYCLQKYYLREQKNVSIEHSSAWIKQSIKYMSKTDLAFAFSHPHQHISSAFCAVCCIKNSNLSQQTEKLSITYKLPSFNSIIKGQNPPT
jgi:hypothetical protein